jgi:checkpoint serine/threonine-protein kinase
MLAKRGCIYDMPSLSLPRGFCKHSSMQGSEITLGDKTGVVSGELGRGTYGVVVLMDISQRWQGSPHDTCIAVKAQTPTDCLALEYVLLKKIEDRTGSHRTSKDPKAPFPFPRPLSFVSLADGGLLGMTAGSRTGLNLVDLVNVYKISERSPVPELIALHYTARMLLVLELLHWHGKILHCDVKPDNWVLMESATAFVSCRDEIEASDLMLVDFGRAVDLTDAAKGGIDPMDVKLFGDAAGEDMACVAMRKGLGWSFDVDTYGLCASAHVLLFGTHLEVEEDHSSRRWKPRKPLRRYWQKEIWQEVFDTLLNLDEVTGNAIGSRSRSLRSLRTMIEDHLSDRGRELESLLRHQARILPSSRPT